LGGSVDLWNGLEWNTGQGICPRRAARRAGRSRGGEAGKGIGQRPETPIVFIAPAGCSRRARSSSPSTPLVQLRNVHPKQCDHASLLIIFFSF